MRLSHAWSWLVQCASCVSYKLLRGNRLLCLQLCAWSLGTMQTAEAADDAHLHVQVRKTPPLY